MAFAREHLWAVQLRTVTSLIQEDYIKDSVFRKHAIAGRDPLSCAGGDSVPTTGHVWLGDSGEDMGKRIYIIFGQTNGS